MEKMIAYCGLVCSDCGAFIATQKNDDKMRAEVAIYGTEVTLAVYKRVS